MFRQLGLTGGRLTRSLLRPSDEMETTQNIPWTLTQAVCLRGIDPYFFVKEAHDRLHPIVRFVVVGHHLDEPTRETLHVVQAPRTNPKMMYYKYVI
jgi:hypothetical protein